MTRFQTYQMPWGFITIDTNIESAPEDFVAGPFMVNMSEAEMIDEGATIEVMDDDVSVYFEGEVS